MCKSPLSMIFYYSDGEKSPKVVREEQKNDGRDMKTTLLCVYYAVVDIASAFPSFKTAWAAAKRAIGTLKGEQLT